MMHENLSLPLRDRSAVRSNNRFMAKHNENKENRVGPVIERRLREMGKSQQWLAEKVGLSPVSIHNWIKNGTIARDNIVPCALALEITTAQLMGEAKEEVRTQPDQPAKMSLQWLLPDEQELLEDYRLLTDEGKNMTRSFARVGPKKDSSETQSGRRHAA